MPHLGKRECRHLLGRHLLSVAASQVPGTRHRAEPRQRNGLLGAPGRGESQLETSARHGPPGALPADGWTEGCFWCGILLQHGTYYSCDDCFACEGGSHKAEFSGAKRTQISETHSGLVRARQMHFILCLLLGRSRVCGFRSSYKRKATSSIQTPKMSTLK